MKYYFLPSKLAILNAGKDMEQHVMTHLVKVRVNW